MIDLKKRKQIRCNNKLHVPAESAENTNIARLVAARKADDIVQCMLTHHHDPVKYTDDVT